MYNNSAQEIKNEAKNAVREIAKDYPELDDVKKDAIALKNSAKGLVNHALADGKECLASAGEKASEHLDVLKGKSQVQLARAEEFVRNKPGQSLAAAFVGGIILSLLFRK